MKLLMVFVITIFGSLISAEVLKDDKFQESLREKLVTSHQLFSQSHKDSEMSLLRDLWLEIQLQMGIKQIVLGAYVIPQIEIHWKK